MAQEFEAVSQLQHTDWNAEWARLQRVRRTADDAQYWNKRSKNFDEPSRMSPYVTSFLQMADVKEGERVLDMGCGTGSLAVPLALRGCHVLAADFSEGMLEECEKRAAAAGVADLVETRLLAWDDDWDAAGLGSNSVDVAFASRSIATYDLRGALLKLHNAARRRCCVTLSCGSSPRMDARILAACGVENTHGRDHQYAWNILVNEGLRPSVAYIESPRLDTFDTRDGAFEDFDRMLTDVVDVHDVERLEAGRERLRAWLDDNLVPNAHVGEPDDKGHPQGVLTLREPRIITWAFISWDVCSVGLTADGTFA